jgi:hypothetical protein
MSQWWQSTDRSRTPQGHWANQGRAWGAILGLSFVFGADCCRGPPQVLAPRDGPRAQRCRAAPCFGFENSHYRTVAAERASFAGLDVFGQGDQRLHCSDTDNIVREAKVASEPEALLAVRTNPARRTSGAALPISPRMPDREPPARIRPRAKVRRGFWRIREPRDPRGPFGRARYVAAAIVPGGRFFRRDFAAAAARSASRLRSSTPS